MASNTEALLALAGTIFGGAGLKGLEAFLGKAKKKDDTATSLREELRKENSELRAELHRAEEAEDEWRSKYYALVARATALGVPIDP